MFRERFAESSKTSKKAFWLTVGCSLGALLIVAFHQLSGSEALSGLTDYLNFLMFVGLALLFGSLRKDKREGRFRS